MYTQIFYFNIEFINNFRTVLTVERSKLSSWLVFHRSQMYMLIRALMLLETVLLIVILILIAELGDVVEWYGHTWQCTVFWMKKRDKRRPAEGEPGRTGEMEGGGGKRVGTRFGLPDTVGKDLNDRSCLSSSACTFRSVWRLVSSRYDDHRSASYSRMALIGKRLVISVFRRFVLSLSQPELARFSRDYVIFHKPRLQSQSR